MERNTLLEKVNAALEEVRPFLKGDGGNVELVNITDEMKVQIRWLGNCQSCSISAMTIASIGQVIKSQVPEIQGIEAINAIS